MSNKLIKKNPPENIPPKDLSDFLSGKNMTPEETMDYVKRLTTNPSDKTITAVISDLKSKLSDFEAQATIELIASAVEPIHPGITNKLRNAL